ncbi:MAG: GNAT family N-acetyltransferase [Solirubrobacteraceae bacterium]
MTSRFRRSLRDCRVMIKTRVGGPADATAISAIHREAFEGYRSWAPSDWSPPHTTEADITRLADGLGRSDVWCLLALDDEQVIGNVALSLVTREDPEPPPVGTINLWQLFVRPAWHGRGIANVLMEAAVHEARQRGFTRMRLWTPQDQRRARRFYEREGWTLTGRIHYESPFGLPVVEYIRNLEGMGTKEQQCQW